MKTTSIYIMSSLMLICLISSFTINNEVKNLATNDFIKEYRSKGGVLIDVRTPDEFKEGTIADALNINYYDNNFKDQINKIDHSKNIFVFCKSGGRSSMAAKKILKLGFKNVFNLQGGYLSYKQDRK